MQVTLPNTPGDLAYLPVQFRDHAELGQKQLCAVFGTSRETLRLRALRGEIPPPLPGRSPNRPKWSALAINEHIRLQCQAALVAQAQNAAAQND